MLSISFVLLLDCIIFSFRNWRHRNFFISALGRSSTKSMRPQTYPSPDFYDMNNYSFIGKRLITNDCLKKIVICMIYVWDCRKSWSICNNMKLMNIKKKKNNFKKIIINQICTSWYFFVTYIWYLLWSPVFVYIDAVCTNKVFSH